MPHRVISWMVRRLLDRFIDTLIVVALIYNYFLQLSKNMSQCANNFASIVKVDYFLLRTVWKESKLFPWTNNFHERTETLVSSHVQYYFCTKQLTVKIHPAKDTKSLQRMIKSSFICLETLY